MGLPDFCCESEASSPSVVNVNNGSFIHKTAVTWIGTTRGGRYTEPELLCTVQSGPARPCPDAQQVGKLQGEAGGWGSLKG